MNPHTQKHLISAPSGVLEIALDLPQNQTMRGIALVCHPHPLHGGAMENKVTTTLARAAVAEGLATLRFNFRGVGQSTGVHDNGDGEVDDAACALAWLCAQYPTLPCLIAGFSFGSAMAAKLYARLCEQDSELQTRKPQLRGLVLAGTSAPRYEIGTLPEHTLLLHGQADELIALDDVLQWAAPRLLAVTVVPEANHFFDKKLGFIKSYAERYIAAMWAQTVTNAA